MTTPFTYDFGYSWPILWGYLIPIALFGGLAGLGLWLRWRRWLLVTSSIPAVWALFSMVAIHAFGINTPQRLPTAQFLASGSGRVVDVGAGSGRASVGLLLARPRVTVTGVDIYSGYYGIDDNTPERFMLNARIAGVANRAEALIGDARELPLATGEYDGVISSYAIDHISRDGIPKALSEAGRVLKPGGEFLLMIVNVDWWVLLTSPAMAHHPRADPNHWRTMIETAGFEIVEQGTKPMTLYFLSRKSRSSEAPPSAARED
ncbi:MAG TPA: class I SAM-dependent methyltransferase [Vicinamibacterales bacterium]|nr:class I SAM-dependent methyltransferase [Vicinamibacterales bacterium]